MLLARISRQIEEFDAAVLEVLDQFFMSPGFSSLNFISLTFIFLVFMSLARPVAGSDSSHPQTNPIHIPPGNQS